MMPFTVTPNVGWRQFIPTEYFEVAKRQLKGELLGEGLFTTQILHLPSFLW